MTTQPQPFDTTAIQARCDAATPGTWWRDGSEIHAGEPGTPAASTWVAETVNLNLPDHGEANAAAIVSTHNALPALLARVADLEQQLAKYVGYEPTIAEEMAELGRRLNAVDDVCDAAEEQTATRGTNLPRWVAAVRAARRGDTAAPARDGR